MQIIDIIKERIKYLKSEYKNNKYFKESEYLAEISGGIAEMQRLADYLKDNTEQEENK